MPFVGVGIHLLIAIFFAVHAIRTGRQIYWLLILFSFPLLGSVVYFFAEYLPTTRIERQLATAGASLGRVLDPGRDLREARHAYELTATAENQMRLAQVLLEAGHAEDAARQFLGCLAGPFGAEPDVRLGAARAELARGKVPAAINLLEAIRKESPGYRAEAVTILLAQAYWATGDLPAAGRTFAEASRTYGSVDARAEHAMFALGTGEFDAARRLQREIDVIRKKWTAHNRRLHRDLLANLDAAWARSGQAKA